MADLVLDRRSFLSAGAAAVIAGHFAASHSMAAVMGGEAGRPLVGWLRIGAEGADVRILPLDSQMRACDALLSQRLAPMPLLSAARETRRLTARAAALWSHVPGEECVADADVIVHRRSGAKTPFIIWTDFV